MANEILDKQSTQTGRMGEEHDFGATHAARWRWYLITDFAVAPTLGATFFSKAALFEAVVATDQWIDSKAANYNAALPATYRNNATETQKTLVFCAVALARVSINLLRRVLGEVG